MRWFVLAAALVAMGPAALAQRQTGAARTQPETTPNALTAAEVKEGWVLLFDGETPFGWSSRGDAVWTEGGGIIEARQGGMGSLATTTSFADYLLRGEVWVSADAAAAVAVRAPLQGSATQENSYLVRFQDGHARWPTGSIVGLAPGKARRPTVGRWTPFAVRAEGDRITVEVDGRPCASARDARFQAGAVSLTYGGSGIVRFRSLRLQPLGAKPLFNGKDLQNWTVVPGHPSIYSVTSEGWLNVRGGNGDIQTTSTHGDFVLQLDVISNGDHLNSGVFFRAIPGVFWSGYEVQIRNQWEGSERAKPVDFGTGGLYNRQPARKVVSTDRQWFTVTLVAVGMHLSTWVDGIQVTDFIDQRPVDQNNARNGARTAPGVITLQGHDPTTDLSFRSIRVADYPAPPAAK
ncbi:MAG: DUF1080 domain-containing protein [Armatimonadetes bacterium]|nr:DUF1080 domain-containing protein [Armatimonadota bacterium]